MHYKFCVSFRNNWDKYVTLCKKIAKCVTSYLVSSTLLEYIWKMINGSHRWTKRLFVQKNDCDDCFKEKNFITKSIYIILLSLHSLLSVTSWSHTSEEGKSLLECDSKEESLKFHFFYMFSDYVMFLFRNNNVTQAILSFSGLVTASSFHFSG